MKGLELFEGSVIFAGEGGFVADQEGKGGSAIGHIVEGPGYVGVVAGGFEFWGHPFGSFEQEVAQEVGFHVGQAVHAPVCGGHGVDDAGFHGGLGLELVEVVLDEGLEFLGGFAGEEELFGEQAVFDGVLCGSGFTF